MENDGSGGLRTAGGEKAEEKQVTQASKGKTECANVQVLVVVFLPSFSHTIQRLQPINRAVHPPLAKEYVYRRYNCQVYTRRSLEPVGSIAGMASHRKDYSDFGVYPPFST